MLVIKRALGRSQKNDEGAVLVTVVVVMLVGFVIAVAIAGSVLFTVQANGGNKSRTQSFVSAESGRDAALKSLIGAIDADGKLTCTTAMLAGSSTAAGAPQYSYSIRTTKVANPEVRWSDLTAADAVCPSKGTQYVVIQSVGTAAGSSSTLDAVYPWREVADTQPAGTMAYFDGSFTATKSTYTGDLVIRGSGDYYCNNGAGNALDGDLWILNANFRSTDDCHVKGNVYVKGNVDIKNNNLIIEGDLITMTGNIELAVDNATIGGNIYSGKNVILSKSGTLTGTLKAVGTITTPVPAEWKHPGGGAITGMPSQPAPVIAPTMQAVYDATKWLELTSTTQWGTDVQNYSGLCSAADLKTPLQTAGARAVFDMNGCGNNGGKVTLNLGNITLARDALFVVPVGKKLTVDLTTTISKGAGDPQLVIVQLDSSKDNVAPSCTGGSSFDLSGGSTVAVRTMLYSPCGITSTTAITLTGQLYLGSNGIHLNGGTFTCKAMSWAPAFNNLGCGVRGSDGIFDPDRVRVSVESLKYQAEY